MTNNDAIKILHECAVDTCKICHRNKKIHNGDCEGSDRFKRAIRRACAALEKCEEIDEEEF